MHERGFPSQWLALRWRWYRFQTREQLARHGNAVTLAILVLGPVAIGCCKKLGLVLLTAAGGRPGPALLAIGSVLVATTVWVQAQAEAVRGGEFARFIGSMPVPRRLLLAVDLMILAATAMPLALILACAVCAAPWASLSLVDGLALGIRLAALCLVQVTVTHGILARRWMAAATGMLACALIPLGAHLPSWQAVLLALLAVVVALGGTQLSLGWHYNSFVSLARRPRQLRPGVLHPLMRIQLRALLSRSSTVVRTCVAAGFAWGATAFGLFLDPAEAIWWLLLGMGVATTVLSAWHMEFRAQRDAMREILAPLPLGRGTIALIDGLLVGSATAVMGIGPYLLAAAGHALTPFSGIGVGIALLVLVAVQQPLRSRCGEEAPLVMAASWVIWAVALGDIVHALGVAHGRG